VSKEVKFFLGWIDYAVLRRENSDDFTCLLVIKNEYTKDFGSTNIIIDQTVQPMPILNWVSSTVL
jgi:hypothetical protein